MKKVLAGLAASTLLLVVAAPVSVMAWGGFPFPWPNPTPEPTTEAVVNNNAYVKNVVDTYAGSGGNSVSGFLNKGVIKTGNAWAYADVANTVNMNALGCNCYNDLTINNRATVKNYLDTTAKTGHNYVGGSWVNGFVKTGAADAMSVVENMVNTNMVGVSAD